METGVINHAVPVGVIISPVSKINFRDSAFDPRKWTILVFWRERTGKARIVNRPLTPVPPEDQAE